MTGSRSSLLMHLRAALAVLLALHASVGVGAFGAPAFELSGTTLCAAFEHGLPEPDEGTATQTPSPVFTFVLESPSARLRLLAPREDTEAPAQRFCADTRPHAAPAGPYLVVGELHRASVEKNQTTRFPFGDHALPPPPGGSEPQPPACAGAAPEPGYWSRPPGGGGGGGPGGWAEWVSLCHLGMSRRVTAARLAARLRRAPVWLQVVGDSVARQLTLDLCFLLTSGGRWPAVQQWVTGHLTTHSDLIECAPPDQQRSLVTFQARAWWVGVGWDGGM